MQKARKHFIASVLLSLFWLPLIDDSQAARAANPTTEAKPQSETASLDPSKIVYLLRQKKTIKPDQPLNVFVTQRLATVMTERRAGANDNDIKIDSVLIAHEIIGGFADQISKVRIIFQRLGSTSADQVDVTAVDVKAYGMGAVDINSLLSSLDVTKIDLNENSQGSSNSLHVVEGPLLDKRLLLLSRIEALKSKGTSVKPFMDIFDSIEREAPTHSESYVAKAVAFLADKLAEQENLLKESHLPASHSVPSIYSGAGNGAQVGGNGTNRATLFQNGGLEAIKRLHTKLERWHNQGIDVTQDNAKLAEAERLLQDPNPAKRLSAFSILRELEQERKQVEQPGKQQWRQN